MNHVSIIIVVLFLSVSDPGRIEIFSEQDGCLYFKILKFCLPTGCDDGRLSGTGSQEGGTGPGTPGRETSGCLNHCLLS